jgi:prepilin-type N-terminal cleavage/methylation domain-containing protein
MKPNGFTLLELLIAGALIAVAATVIASAFAAGFRVWQRASEKGDGDAVMTLELMQKDLANTAPFRLVSFQGSQSRIEIPALIQAPAGEGRQEQLGAIRYEFNAASRTLDRVIRWFPLPGADQEKRETLMDSVESVRFAYGDGGAGNGGGVAWGSDWLGRTNTPAAVKVELEFKQGDERIERARTIILPCR